MSEYSYLPGFTRFRASLIGWIQQRNSLLDRFQTHFEGAITCGDAEGVKILVDQYHEAIVEEYLTLVPELSKCKAPEIADSPWSAIGAFSLVYALLDTAPMKILMHPVFGAMLLGLRKGNTDLFLGSICRELLGCIGKKIVEPTTLIGRAIASVYKANRQHDTALDTFLQRYELLHQHVKKIWSSTRLRDREKALYDAYPFLKEVFKKGTYADQYNPEYVAFHILAYELQGNVSDLRRLRAKARKIRKALKDIGIPFAPPVDIKVIESLVKQWTNYSKTPGHKKK